MEEEQGQQQREPTMGDVVNSLKALISSVDNISTRLNQQEVTIFQLQDSLNDIQPRVSILFDAHDRADDNDPETKEDRSSIPKSSAPKSSDNRKSMFQKNVDETVTLAERHSVVVQRQTPSHSHIFLSSTDLAEYAQFVNRWFDWEIQHGIKLEPALIVSKNVRNQIMYNNDKTDTDFNSLTPSQFCSLMANETRVFSKVQFAETLKHAMKDVKVLLWESVRPSTHERFFQGILRRQKLFTRTFQILMEANKDFCPTLEGKEFGLAQIFLDTVDRSYNKYILAEIPKVKDQNYTRLSDFLCAYVAKAKAHFEAGRSIRLVPYGGNDFKMASASKPSTFNPNFKSSKPNFSSNTRRLNFVDVSVEEDNSGSDDDNPRGRDSQHWRDVDSDGEAEVVPPMVHDNVPDSDQKDGVSDCQFEADFSQELQAVSNVDKSKDYVKGCVNFALYGNCFNGDSCKNVQGHSESIAKDTREWMIRKLTSVSGKARAPPLIQKQRDAADGESKKLSTYPSRASWPKKIVQRDRPDVDFE
jgi:hypothetical protein